MKKWILLFFSLCVAFIGIVPLHAEELTLKTILPRQDELRGSRGAVGTPSDDTWNYQDVALNEGWLRVGHAVWIGDVITPPVNAELHIREDSDRDDATHPRIVMEDRLGHYFFIEMDNHTGIDKLQYYYHTGSHYGLYQTVLHDRTIRFYRDVMINTFSDDPVGTVARLAIGKNVPYRDLDVDGDSCTNTLILNPIDPATITATAGRAVNGMLICDSTDGNRLKQYTTSGSAWNGFPVCGHYTGDGQANRRIRLGFRPDFVQITCFYSSGAGKGTFTKMRIAPWDNAHAEGFGSAAYYGDCNITCVSDGLEINAGVINSVNVRDANKVGQEYYYMAWR